MWMSRKKERKMCPICGRGMECLGRVTSTAGVQADWWNCRKCRIPSYCRINEAAAASDKGPVQRNLTGFGDEESDSSRETDKEG